MKRKIISIILTLTMVLSMLPGVTLTASTADYSGGSGTADNPYQISSVDDLKALADAVNSSDNQSGKCFKLTGDITLTGTWTPIGNGNTSFTGTFDGDGHTISGLYINSDDSSYQALFGCVGKGGTVKNVGVVNSTVIGKNYVAGVAGYVSEGTVENCYNSATVSGTSYIGGVVGYSNGGTVTKCYNTGDVTADSSSLGGVVGYSYEGTVENCYNSATVRGYSAVGGVVGGTGGDTDGGTVTKCHNTGNVTADNATVGGVVGSNRGNCIVEYCYNTGDVSGTGIDYGGVVGWNYFGDVKNCYNTGNITSDGTSHIGGVVGENGYSSRSAGEVENCYNIGKVSSSGTSVGSVVGGNDQYSIVKNCYFKDGTASGGIGRDNGTAENVVQKTAEEFKSLASGLGDDVWADSHTLDRPIIKSNPEAPLVTSIESATVTVSGIKAYTGSVQTPTVTVEMDGEMLTANDDYTVSFNPTEVKNAGQYTVTVTGVGNYEGMATGNFTIEKATPAVTPPSAKTNLTYTGQAQELVTAGKTTGGTMQYSTSENSGYSTSIPTATNAGSYTVYYKVVGDSNYNDVAARSVSVTIGKADSAVTPSVSNDAVMYGDMLTLTAEVKIAALAAGQDEVEFFAGETSLGTAKVENGKATLTVKTTDKKLSIGENIITAVYGGSTNLSLNNSKTNKITVVISKKTVTATISGSTTKAYDGTDMVTGLTLTLSGVVEGDDVTAVATSFTFDSAEVGTGKTITANGVRLSGAQAEYYQLSSAPITTTGTIVKAVASVTAPAADTTVFTYNGTEQTYTIEPSEYYTVSNNTRIDAGEQTVTIALEDKDNCVWADGGTEDKLYTFTIKPYGLTVPAESFDYNGGTTFTNEKVPTGVNGEEISVTFTTSAADVGEYSYSSGGIAGSRNTYTASITDGNYTIIDGETLTIEAAALDVAMFNFIKPDDLIYTGEGKTATVTAKSSYTGVGTITVHYYCEDGSEVAMSPVSVGTYTVKINVAASDNYNEVNDLEVGTFTISYLDAPKNPYTISGEIYRDSDVYWLKDSDQATISPADGYQIATVLGDNYNETLTVSEWTSGNAVYLKDAQGHMTDAILVTETVKADDGAPAGQITLNDRTLWQKFLNVISFGLFYKNEQKATIKADDANGSGVANVQYYLANAEMTIEEVMVISDWQNYESSIGLPEAGKYVVYAKITDNVGHVTYISSDGIVIYFDAKAVTESIEYIKTSKEDKVATVMLNGNTIDEIKNGNTTLEADTDYTVEESTITFKGDWLDSLDFGEYALTISYNPQGEEYRDAVGNDVPLTTTIALTVKKMDAPNIQINFIDEILVNMGDKTKKLEFADELDGEWLPFKDGMSIVEYEWDQVENDIYIRYAEDKNHIFEIQTLTIPARPDIPTDKIKVSKTDSTIIITNTDEHENLEYSIDGENWNEHGEFTGLEAGETYTLYMRSKAMDPVFESVVITLALTTEEETESGAFASESKTKDVSTVDEDGNTTLMPDETMKTENGGVTNNGDNITFEDTDITITPPTGKNFENGVGVAGDGRVTVPDGSTVHLGNDEPDITVGPGNSGTVSEDGSVTLPGGGSAQIDNTTVTVSEKGGTITPNEDGTVDLPGGSTVEQGSKTVTIPEDGGFYDPETEETHFYYYTVTIDRQDGAVPETVRLAYGDTLTKPVDPTRAGYTFGGWYTDASCTFAYDFSTPILYELTIYAKWTENDEPADPTPTPEPSDPTDPTPTPEPSASTSTPEPSASTSTPAPTPGLDVENAPNTGEETNITLWFYLMFVSGVALVALLRKTRKNDKTAK